MSKGYEGYTQGVKELFLKSEISGIKNTLADIITGFKLENELVMKILEDYLEVILLDDEKTFESVLHFVNNKNYGNMKFAFEKSNSENNNFSSDKCKPLADYLEFDEENRNLINSLFGNFFVVENKSDALDLIEKYPTYHFLSMEDKVMYSHGYRQIFGAKSKINKDLIGRKNKIKDLEIEIDKISKELEIMQGKIIEVTEEKEAKERKFSEEITHANSLNTEINNLKSSLMFLHKETNALMEEEKKIENSISFFDSEIEKLEKEKEEINDSLEILNEKLDTLDEKLETLEGDSEELKREKAYLESDLNKLKIEKASKTSQKEQIESELIKIREMTKEGGERLNHFQELLKMSEETIDKANKELHSLNEEMENLKNSRKTEVIELDNIIRAKKEFLNSVKEIEKTIEEKRNKKDTLKEEIHQVDLQISKIEMELENIVQKIKEKYGQDIPSYGNELDSADFNELVQLEEEIETKIKNLGSVNMLAIDEYEEEQERFDFLVKQRDDLIQAKETLLQAIKKINKTARDMFREIFEKVSKNFEEVFTYLFGGGEASISMDENSDPLEAKIEIFAQPKGKKARTISLLSGGERALTALSLLFAIYLVKPSPYCILDEVDAPLDEANVMRFLNLLRKFGENTQFIMITHNKRSMEAADYLYGVTQEETGVSKLVSVKVKELENSVITGG